MNPLEKIFPVFHGVQSAQRLIEAARACYSIGYKAFIASRVLGAAAQQGIPELHRIAYKMQRNLLIMKDLPDVVELLSPKALYLAVPPESGIAAEPLPLEDIKTAVTQGEAVAIAFSGGEPGFSRRELELGKPVVIVNRPLDGLALLIAAMFKVAEQLEASSL